MGAWELEQLYYPACDSFARSDRGYGGVGHAWSRDTKPGVIWTHAHNAICPTNLWPTHATYVPRTITLHSRGISRQTPKGVL